MTLYLDAEPFMSVTFCCRFVVNQSHVIRPMTSQNLSGTSEIHDFLVMRCTEYCIWKKSGIIAKFIVSTKHTSHSYTNKEYHKIRPFIIIDHMVVTKLTKISNVMLIYCFVCVCSVIRYNFAWEPNVETKVSH